MGQRLLDRPFQSTMPIRFHHPGRAWSAVRSAAAVLLLGVLPAASSAQALDPKLDEAVRWYTGVAGHVDDERAAQLLVEAAEDHDALSVMWLARVHSTGRMGFPEDPDHAKEIASGVIDQVEALAAQGEVEALFLMGTAYAEGLGVDPDPEVAAVWYRRAGRQGHVLAQHNLGNIHFSGTGVPKSDSLAVVWWTRAAEQGDAIPARRLGIMYESGLGVEADMESAIRWYHEAARRGDGPAAEALERLGR